MLARLWTIAWGSAASRSLLFLLLIVGLLRWAGKWEWWCWILVVLYGWWSLRDAVLREWAPKAINRMARPTVWTFRFSFSKRHVESFLAERGVQFRFDEASKDRPGEFPDRLVVESYPDRLRVHRWLVPADKKSAPPKYDWFDTPRPGEALLWSYPLSDAGHAEHHAIKLSVLLAGDKKSNRLFRRLTLWLDHGIRRMPVGPFPTIPSVDIVFEVPLEADLLGDHPGDPSQELKQICRTEVSDGGYTWACYAGAGDQFDWGWSLCLKPIDLD
jgi:hypothetical protein